LDGGLEVLPVEGLDDFDGSQGLLSLAIRLREDVVLLFELLVNDFHIFGKGEQQEQNSR
jgi:hypothetical protein